MSQELFDFIWKEETSAALAELENKKEKVTRNINEEFKLTNGYTCTCLYGASEDGQDTVVEGILSVVGVDVNKGGPYSMTPLHVAAINNHPTTARLLLQAGARCFGDCDGDSPIHCAVRKGSTAVLQEMLKYHPGQVNQQGKLKFTSLHWAAERGYLTEAILLIEGGADPNMKDNDKKTAYDVALEENNNDVAMYLKEIKQTQQILSTVLHPTHMSKTTANVPAVNPPTASMVSSLITAPSNQPQPPNHGVTEELKEIDPPQQTLSRVLQMAQNFETTARVPTMNPPTAIVVPSSISAPSNQPQLSLDGMTEDLNKIKKTQCVTLSQRPKNTDIIETPQSTKIQSLIQRLNTNENSLGNHRRKLDDHAKKSEHHGKKIDDHRRRFDDLENRLARLEVTGDSKDTTGTGGADIKEIVRDNFIFLTENLIAEEHMAYLYQERALSEEDIEKIEGEKGKITKNKRMLWIMSSKPPQYWTTQFKESIQRTFTTQHVCKKLKWEILSSMNVE